MICSALPGEGKSLTCANLALTLSRSYSRRVLLIDADLRHPVLHEIFGVRANGGLAHDLLSSGGGLQLIDVADGVALLPAGPPSANPTAVIASEHMRAAFTEAAQRFDWVIVDSPPIALISDANLMARMVDGVILVVAAGSTPYDVVQKAIEDIGRERIIGTVLNRVQRDVLGSSDYYYQHAPRGTVAST